VVLHERATRDAIEIEAREVAGIGGEPTLAFAALRCFRSSRGRRACAPGSRGADEPERPAR
jgi:hypothetical protein